MRAARWAAIVTVLWVGWGYLSPPAAAAAAARPEKKGIVLVAFGTSVPAARAVYEGFEARVRAAFPDVPVRRAYTSAVLRARTAEEGQRLASLPSVLAP